MHCAPFLSITASNSSEQQRYQELVSVLHTESELLQQIECQENNGTVHGTVSQHVTALWKRFSAC